MNQAELAGKFLKLQSSDLFNEGLEGVLGGGLAGMGLLGTDTPLPQVAIQTLGGMALGTGIGMLGNRMGAAIGKMLHSAPLKNQNGLLATLSRATGQKTLMKGGSESIRYGKGQIKQELRKQSTAQLLDEALTNPQQFNAKYGIDADTFKTYQGAVDQSGQFQALLETVQNISPEKRKEVANLIQNRMNQGFNQTENLINTQAANSMDANLGRMAEQTKGTMIGDTDLGGIFESLMQEAQPITGEHVGRAAGRFIGDEVGVLAGLGLGGMAAGAMGIKSDKDKKIDELQTILLNNGLVLPTE
jgi:hypothetical protein